MSYSDRAERACARLQDEFDRRLTIRLLWVAGAALLALAFSIITK